MFDPIVRFFKRLAWSFLMPGSSRSFNHDLYAMVALMANADGRIDREEAATLSDLVALFTRYGSASEQSEIFAYMREVRNHTTTFDDYAASFKARVKGDSIALGLAVDFLITIAGSNGMIEAKQHHLLERAAEIFGIRPAVLRSRIAQRANTEEWEPEDQNEKAHEERDNGWSSAGKGGQQKTEWQSSRSFSTDELEWAYIELGCEVGASAATLKKQYRQAVMEYHPDRLAAKNLSPLLIEQGRQRFLKLQAAYEALESGGRV